MTSTDDISALLRYRDRIKTETRALAKTMAAGTAPSFNLDPTSLKPITPKIGSAPVPVSQENVRMVKETLKKKDLSPHAKYPAPQTASMEVGWLAHHTELAQPFKRFGVKNTPYY